MSKKYAFPVVFSLALVVCLAQQAPRETVSFKLEGGSVAVEYGRPSLRGRSFDELATRLPEDRIWRAGSDQITTLATEVDLLLGNTRVLAGKYSLYIHCPQEGPFSLVLNGVLGQPLGKIWAAAPEHLEDEPWPHLNYEAEIQDSEVARVPMRKVEGKEATDLLTFTLAPAEGGALLEVTWGEMRYALDLNPAR